MDALAGLAPFLQVGAGGLLTIGILMILTGRLVPGGTVEKLLAARDRIIEQQQTTIDRQNERADLTAQQLTILLEKMREMQQIGRPVRVEGRARAADGTFQVTVNHGINGKSLSSDLPKALPVDVEYHAIGLSNEDKAYWVFEYDQTGQVALGRKYSERDQFIEAKRFDAGSPPPTPADPRGRPWQPAQLSDNPAPMMRVEPISPRPSRRKLVRASISTPSESIQRAKCSRSSVRRDMTSSMRARLSSTSRWAGASRASHVRAMRCGVCSMPTAA